MDKERMDANQDVLELSSKKRRWQTPKLEKLLSDEIAGGSINVPEGTAGGVLDVS